MSYNDPIFDEEINKFLERVVDLLEEDTYYWIPGTDTRVKWMERGTLMTIKIVHGRLKMFDENGQLLLRRTLLNRAQRDRGISTALDDEE